MREKKPWYKSKIVALGVAAILTFGSNLLTGWLGGQGVTPEQLDVLQQVQPDVVHAIEEVNSGGNWVSAIGVLFGAAVIVFRKWFTSKLLT